MRMTEILNELPKLKVADRWAILQRLSELETKEEIDPSSEMAAAIEAGLHSAETEPCYTVEEVRDKAKMDTTVVITTQASQDLREIIDYLAKDNPSAADQFSERLLDLALSLGQAPLVGCRIKGFPDVRMTVHGRYLIIYKVESSKKRLLVLRFWQSARDLKKLRLSA